MARNTVDLHMNIHNSLNRELPKAIKSAEAFNDKLSRSEYATRQLGSNFTGINKALGASGKLLGGISNIAKSLVPQLGIIFGGGLVIQTTREVIKYSQSFRELSHQMGTGANASISYAKTMNDVARETRLATDDIADLISNLAGLRVATEHLEEAATLTSRFSEITGVSASSSARLYGEMMRTGRMGEEASKQILVGMARLQKAFGLTSSEMESVSYGITTITQKMNLLGKTEKETQKMAKGATALAIAFSRVGLEAEEAVDFVNELLDPSRVEENAFLYAKLGISISDAFSGNVDITGKVIPGLKSLGQQLQNMSAPAAAGMAKSLGMSLDTLRQFGEIDLSVDEMKELNRLMSEEGLDASSALKNLQSETRGFDKIMTAISNSVKTLASTFAVELGGELGGAVSSLKNFENTDAFKKINETIKDVASGIGEFIKNSGGLEGLFEKIASSIGGIAKFIVNLPKLLPVIGVGLFVLLKNVRKKLYSSTIGAVKDMTSELKTALEGVYSMSEERSKNILRDKAPVRKEPGGPGIFSAEAISRRNKARMEESQLLVSFAKQQKEAIGNEIEILGEEKEKIGIRLEELSLLRERGGLTTREMAERRRLSNLEEELTTKIQKKETDFTRVDNKALKDRERALNSASTAALRNTYEEISLKKRTNEEAIDNIDKLIEKRKSERQQIETAQVDLIHKLKAAEEAQDGEAILRFNKLLKETGTIERDLTKEIEEQTALKKDLIDTNRDYKKDVQDINRIYKERDPRGDGLSKATTPLGQDGPIFRVLDTTGQLFSKMKLGITRAASSVANSFGGIIDHAKISVKKFSKDLKEQTALTLFKAGKRVVSAPIQGVGKLLNGFKGAFTSSIGSLLGPMALISVAMKLLQPVITELEPTLKILTDAFKDVFLKIIKAIMPPLLKVLAALIPLLAVLVNVAVPPLILALGGVMKAVGWLISVLGKLFRKENIEEIGDTLKEGASDTIEAGKELWENKVLDDKAVKSIQDGLTSTADRLASGEIVVTTKEKKDVFSGATLSLDKDGNIKVDYKEIAEAANAPSTDTGKVGGGNAPPNLQTINDMIAKVVSDEAMLLQPSIMIDAETAEYITKLEEGMPFQPLSLITDAELEHIAKVVGENASPNYKTINDYIAKEVGHYDEGMLLQPSISDVEREYMAKVGLSDEFSSWLEGVNKGFLLQLPILDAEREYSAKVGGGNAPPNYQTINDGIAKEAGLFDEFSPFSKELLEKAAERGYSTKVGDGNAPSNYRAINDGIIYKGGNVVETHPDDNIIASKATPKIVNSQKTYSNNVQSIYSNELIISLLEDISEGIDGMLVHEKKSVENLEEIKNSSVKTARQTRTILKPVLEI